MLFIGTIRSNLDPFGRYLDKEIWSALKKVNLESTVQNLPGGLDYTILEGGENFSVGTFFFFWLTCSSLVRTKTIGVHRTCTSPKFTNSCA